MIAVAPVLAAGLVLVTVPVLFTAAVWKVTVPAAALLLFKIVRLLLPVTPPEKVVAAKVPPIPNVPVEAFVCRTNGLGIFNPVVVTKKLAALEPLVWPIVIALDEFPPQAVALQLRVPALTFSPVVKVLVPDKAKAEVVEF